MCPNDMVTERPPSDPANNGPNNSTTSAAQRPAPTIAGTGSNASTISNEDRQSGPTEQRLLAMDLAYDELQSTIREATAVRERQGVRPRLIQSHIEALHEDSTLLSSFETPDDDKRTKATQLVLEARRLKRHLERDLIDLDIDDGDTQNREIVEFIPLTDKRASGLKLAPLKLPVFSGDISQFRVFRDLYEENVLNSDQLTDTAKWLRLTESLAGQPAELISEIPKTTHTLTIAWKLLLDIYGGDDRPIVQLYERLQRLPAATNSTTSLRMTHSKLEGILLSLENLEHDVSDNGYIRWVYMSKFPVEVAYQVQKKKTTPLLELRTSINELLLARESVDQHSGVASTSFNPPAPPQRPVNQFSTDRKKPTTQAQTTTSTRPLRCVFCTGEHWNDVCTIYPSLEARRDRLTGKCFICLRRQHTGSPCITQRRCFHCDSFEHNRALCPTKFQEPVTKPVVQASVVADGSPMQPSGCFLTFLAQASSRIVTDPIQLRVVVDTAGGSTVIRKEAAQRLQLAPTKESTAYTGLGDAKLISSFKLQETIQLIPPNEQPIEIHAEMVDWIIPDVPTANVQQFRDQHPELNDVVIPPTGEGEPIDLLIGSDMLVDILLPERIIAADKNTVLMPTKFGSLIVGRQRGQQQVCHSLLFHILKNPLQQMCNLDLVGLSGLTSSNIEDEQRAIQNFYDTLRFLEGRYSISWPWRCYPPQLDSNFGLALGRLRSLYRKLKNTPHLLRDYHAIIQQQLADGIIEKVDFRKRTTNWTHYVPHHPVIQPLKSTAVRPVYDGSSKSAVAKRSLNDNILKGKNWLTDLVKTLIAFRKFKNVATADIAKAFHQIAINEDDRDVVRFLWLKDPSQPPEDDNLQCYRFTRVAFGIVASPFILSATIKHHANQQQKNKFVDILVQNLYADNLVVALQDDVSPTEFYDYAKGFFGSMKMNLTKWSSTMTSLSTYHKTTSS